MDSFKDATDHFTVVSTKTSSLQKPEDDLLLSADEIPSWLSERFIQSVLEEQVKNSKVKRLRIERFGGKGESFSLSMFRVGTFYCDENHPETENFRSLIIKTLPTNDFAAETLGAVNCNVQDTEMEMYQRVLPEFRRILESVDEDGSFYASALDVNKEFDAIILEDLIETKYVMADRFIGLDLNHVQLTLRNLARMHAASVVVNENNPAALAKFDMGIFSRKNTMCHVMFESMCDVLIEEVSTWEGYAYYANKLKTVRKHLIENGLRVFDCDDGDFRVLTHGDLWTNNIMFRYRDDGIPLDCVFIDFQMPSIASPAVDLLYFLFGSTTDDLRENNVEELLQYYYYELTNVLTRLAHNMKSFPTLQAFQMQILKKYFYAFTTSLFEFAIMLTQDEDASFSNLMGTDENAMNFKRRLFKDQRFQRNAKMMLKRLDAKGILDDL